jgi:hypothetical protein
LSIWATAAFAVSFAAQVISGPDLSRIPSTLVTPGYVSPA